MKTTIFIASNNKHKIQEISDIMDLEDFTLKSCSELGTISMIEDGSTFLENARKKLNPYLRLTESWILADDSGLEVPALNGAPGVYSARYAMLHNDKANNEKLLKELNPFKDKERRARFVCALALGFKGSEVFHAEGTVEGYITGCPRGNSGFGYDPLFYYPPSGKTLAEMSNDEKNKISHRGNALAKLRAFLRKQIEPGN